MIPSPLPGYTVADPNRKSHHPAPWGPNDRWFVVNLDKLTVVEGHPTEARAIYATMILNEHEKTMGRTTPYSYREKK